MLNLTIYFFFPPYEEKIRHYYVGESKYGVERPEVVNERLPAADLSKNAAPADVSAFRTMGTLWGWVHLPSPPPNTKGVQPQHVRLLVSVLPACTE